jgi:drug/metabolite transporter (DMT)-like permease
VGRYLAYGLMALALAVPRWRSLTTRLTRPDWFALVWLGLAGNVIYYIFLAAAVRMAGPAPASFIVGLLPVVITIVGSREEGAIAIRTLAPSLLLAVIGVGLIAAASMTANGGDWKTQSIGLFCAFGALASWALFAVGNSRRIARLPQITSNEWSLLLGIVTGAESLLLAIPAFALAPAHDAGAWIRFAAVSAGVAIFASIIGNGLWNNASRKLPMTLMGQMVIFETLFALFYSFLWERRAPTPLEIAAIIALIAAVSWCAAHHRRAPAAPV